MTPFHEPMAGEVTGVTTSKLVKAHGPIRARLEIDDTQYIVFAKKQVFRSAYFPQMATANGASTHGGDCWLPWEAADGCRVEFAPNRKGSHA